MNHKCITDYITTKIMTAVIIMPYTLANTFITFNLKAKQKEDEVICVGYKVGTLQSCDLKTGSQYSLVPMTTYMTRIPYFSVKKPTLMTEYHWNIIFKKSEISNAFLCLLDFSCQLNST